MTFSTIISLCLKPEYGAGRLRPGVTIAQGGRLNDPLGMTRAPNGNIIVTNGGDGNLVEITDDGQQVAKRLVDSSGSPPGSGALFGLAAVGNQVFFVDDATNFFNVAENDPD